MDARLKEMLDHHEIRKTLARYCHGCDRGDEGRMAGVYLEDSWDDHGAVKASGPEFARIMTKTIRDGVDSLHHMLGQSQIFVCGDTASSETYFTATMLDIDGATRTISQLGGRYLDDLERDGDSWRIKNRLTVRDWSIAHRMERDWESTLALTPGHTSGADPSYSRLGIVRADETSA